MTLALQQSGLAYEFASDYLKSQKHIQELALFDDKITVKKKITKTTKKIRKLIKRTNNKKQ